MVTYKDFKVQFDKFNINEKDGGIILNYFEGLASLLLNNFNNK